MMRSGNPALNFSNMTKTAHVDSADAMTIQGAVNKTFILLFLVMFSAYWSWGKILQSAVQFYGETGQILSSSSFYPAIIGAFVFSLIFSLVTIFKKEWAAVTAPLYALCQGVLLGAISATFELQFPGIVVQAIALTFGTLFSLLLVYKSGIIKVNDKFRLGVVAATGGIFIVYFLNWVLSFFGRGMPFTYAATPFGIGFSVVVVVIASLNLILDFDFIERGAQYHLPRHMEWYAAFGLMVTLIWLYIEILILLVKLRSRR